MKRLVLHLGTTKTGSSAIQNALTLNRRTLLARGIHYPSSLRPKFDAVSERIGNAAALTSGFSGEQRRVAREQRTEILTGHILAQHERCHTTILSTEFFEGERAEGIESIVAGLPRYDRVDGIIYLRETSRWLESLYREHVRDKAVATAPDQFLGRRLNMKDAFGVHFVKEHWKYFGDALSVRVYDTSELYAGDVVADFFHAVVPDFDTDVLEAAEASDVNAAFSAAELGLIVWFNRRDEPLNGVGNAEFIAGIRGLGADLPTAGFGGFFDESALRAMQQELDEPSTWIARRFFNRDVLFRPGFATPQGHQEFDQAVHHGIDLLPAAIKDDALQLHARLRADNRTSRIMRKRPA